MSSISLTNVTVTFPDGTVGLDNISLDVDDNEFIALVGPSGSGKTTLLRTIAGFLTPTSGSIHIGGTDMSTVPPEKRGMGMVFQQHAVWPHMSVANNVAYPLRRTGIPTADISRRVTHALDLIGLGDFGSRRPASLSGGQRQRVALARAIVADPAVLLLDEALSALDEPLRDTLRRELVALTRTEGLTTVHVTHDRAEALAIADRIVVLDRGVIQQVATPQEILSRPASPHVAAFIADATILDAHRDGTTVTTQALGLSWPLADDAPAGDVSTVAVLPRHVRIDPHGAVSASVTSAIFDGSAYSVTATTAEGTTFRTTSELRPTIGEAIRLSIASPLVY